MYSSNKWLIRKILFFCSVETDQFTKERLTKEWGVFLIHLLEQVTVLRPVDFVHFQTLARALIGKVFIGL